MEPSIADGTNSTPIVQGCTAFLVVYYLDNLACDAAVRSLDVPRSKFFTKDVIDSISKADKVGLTYGKLPLREESLTVYKDIRSSAAVQVSAARDSVELVFTARGGPVTQTTNAPRRAECLQPRGLLIHRDARRIPLKYHRFSLSSLTSLRQFQMMQ